MKTNLLLLFCTVAFCLNAQTESGDALWDYPVKPGMPGWASFTTGVQKREACQIPDNILETLTTKDLVKICLNYPLFLNEAFIKKLNKQESAALEQIVVEKYVRKVENIHVYSVWSIRKTFLLYAVYVLHHSMDSKTPQQQETIRRFIENYMFADESLLSEMSKIISG